MVWVVTAVVIDRRWEITVVVVDVGSVPWT